MAKSLASQEYRWMRDWCIAHIQIKWFYAGDLSRLDNEVNFSRASGVSWSVGMSAAHLCERC